MTSSGPVRSLNKLEWLSLANTQVADAGLVHLTSLSGLQLLYLNHTQITDAGLEHLKSLSDLQVLTRISHHFFESSRFGGTWGRERESFGRSGGESALS